MAFSKLGTNYSSSSKSGKGGDKAPLLGGDSKLEDVQGELNDLLAKLSSSSNAADQEATARRKLPLFGTAANARLKVP